MDYYGVKALNSYKHMYINFINIASHLNHSSTLNTWNTHLTILAQIYYIHCKSYDSVKACACINIELPNPLHRDNPASFMTRGIAGSHVTLCGE